MIGVLDSFEEVNTGFPDISLFFRQSRRRREGLPPKAKEDAGTKGLDEGEFKRPSTTD
jgi:hypothetical protein